MAGWPFLLEYLWALIIYQTKYGAKYMTILLQGLKIIPSWAPETRYGTSVSGPTLPQALYRSDRWPRSSITDLRWEGVYPGFKIVSARWAGPGFLSQVTNWKRTASGTLSGTVNRLSLSITVSTSDVILQYLLLFLLRKKILNNFTSWLLRGLRK